MILPIIRLPNQVTCQESNYIGDMSHVAIHPIQTSGRISTHVAIHPPHIKIFGRISTHVAIHPTPYKDIW